ncbi:MAG TPA: hypothetical protein PKE20_11620, partial [Promineifilum sp.]|nr:hypothetical protein [Promineifilum sp.]
LALPLFACSLPQIWVLYLKISPILVEAIHINGGIRYTLGNCGKKWGDVGQIGVLSLLFTAKMGRYEQVF